MTNGVAVSVPVNLPTPLVSYTGGVRDVVAHGGTLHTLLEDLERQYPGIRFRMINELGRSRAHIKFFINGVLCRDMLANIRVSAQKAA